MDASERAKYKQLANDAIIDTFGNGSREQRLAEALEQAVDHIDYLRTEWRPTCSDCEAVMKTYDEADEADEDGEI